jgi:hypothetical protein
MPIKSLEAFLSQERPDRDELHMPPEVKELSGVYEAVEPPKGWRLLESQDSNVSLDALVPGTDSEKFSGPLQIDYQTRNLLIETMFRMTLKLILKKPPVSKYFEPIYVAGEISELGINSGSIFPKKKSMTYKRTYRNSVNL